jgi:hypothetical protein
MFDLHNLADDTKDDTVVLFDIKMIFNVRVHTKGYPLIFELPHV